MSPSEHDAEGLLLGDWRVGRALMLALVGLSLSISQGCVTSSLWYGGRSLILFDVPRHPISITHEVVVHPLRIQDAAVESGNRLVLTIGYDDGDTRIVASDLKGDALVGIAGSAPVLLPFGKRVALGPLTVTLAGADGGGWVLQIRRGDIVVAAPTVPSWSRVQFNPAWFMAVLATPFTVGLDLATLPVQLLVLLLLFAH
jgi:hypothetical protein